MVVGSNNFSEASQQNNERGVRLRNVPTDEVQDERDRFDFHFARGITFEGGYGRPLPRTPQQPVREDA